jgi:hypothetical protein
MDDNLPERGLSIEMKPMGPVRTVSLSEISWEGALFEGVLGEREDLGVLEEAISMVRGTHGTLRICQKEKGLSWAVSRNKAAIEGS